jgi:hypothetical protein
MHSRREARALTIPTFAGEDPARRDDRTTGVGWLRTYSNAAARNSCCLFLNHAGRRAETFYWTATARKSHDVLLNGGPEGRLKINMRLAGAASGE